MVKKRSLPFIIILVFLSEISNAQIVKNVRCDKAIEKIEHVPVTATYYINEFPSLKDQFYNDWTLGKIVFSNGDIADSCKLRYNGWNDELLWLRETDYKMGIVLKGTVKEFHFYELNVLNNFKTFKKFHDTISLQKQDIYLENLTNGDVSLYCYRKMTYLKSNNIFTKNYQYFLEKNGEMLKFNLRKSGFLNLFNSVEQKQIKSILKVHHLKINNEEQLSQAINLYNKYNVND